MSGYINTGNAGFQSFRNSEYVDKSGLISVVNKTLFTEQRFTCVSRCRRFGKSMAAKMLCAYYDQSCNSHSLFSDLAIAQDPLFEKYLNKYPVIYLDITNFISQKESGIADKIDAASKPPRRYLLAFRKHPVPLQHEELTIGSDAYRTLTRDFYLDF